MGTRTVRLDDETDRIPEEIRHATGISISEVLKHGILAFRKEMFRHASQTPFGVYRELDLGEGGYAIAPSSEVRRGVREALARKHGR